MHWTRLISPSPDVHRFVGADHGGVTASIEVVQPERGSPVGLHTHPYAEVALVQSGMTLWTVGDQEEEAYPGDVVVIEAGEPHAFRSLGPEACVVVSVHLSSRIVRCSATEGGRSSIRVGANGRLTRTPFDLQMAAALYLHLMIQVGGAALGADGLK